MWVVDGMNGIERMGVGVDRGQAGAVYTPVGILDFANFANFAVVFRAFWLRWVVFG